MFTNYYASENTIKKLAALHLGVYELKVVADTAMGDVSETITTTSWIYKKHRDAYTFPMHTVDSFREYTAVELEAAIHETLDGAFSGNPYPDVEITKIAKTLAEYRCLTAYNYKLDNKLSMEDIIRNLMDRIWVIRPIRKRKTNNPPILFSKRDDRYFVIDRSESNWTEKEYTAKQVAAMAELTFGGEYEITQIKF